MTVKILPGKASGAVSAPPSKSIAHRLLLAAALSDEESLIRNLALSGDILATADCIRGLGKEIRIQDGCARLSGPGILHGSGKEALFLPVRESGSTLRFFIPIALMLGVPVRFSGAGRLFERPLSVYETIAAKEGFVFERRENSLLVRGKLQPKEYRIPGNISSQFISGFLFALPFLPQESSLVILPPIESRPYIDMTEAVLRDFGIEIIRESGNRVRIPGSQRAAGRTCTVEGDSSNTAFLQVLNVFGGDVRISGVREDTVQGDRVSREHFKTLRKGFSEIDLSDCPDLGPVLFAAAAALCGGTFTGTARLRLKESDRCLSMQEELLKFGIRCENEADRFTVYPGKIRTPSERLDGHNDHRIVMALASLCTLTGGEIDGPEAVSKSWPEYFDVLKKLGIEVEEHAVDQ